MGHCNILENCWLSLLIMRLLGEFSCLYSGGSTGGGTHEVQELPYVGVRGGNK